MYGMYIVTRHTCVKNGWKMSFGSSSNHFVIDCIVENGNALKFVGLLKNQRIVSKILRCVRNYRFDATVAVTIPSVGNPNGRNAPK